MRNASPKKARDPHFSLATVQFWPVTLWHRRTQKGSPGRCPRARIVFCIPHTSDHRQGLQRRSLQNTTMQITPPHLSTICIWIRTKMRADGTEKTGCHGLEYEAHASKMKKKNRADVKRNREIAKEKGSELKNCGSRERDLWARTHLC